MKKRISIKSITKRVSDEIDSVLKDINEEDTKKLINLIAKSKRIFVFGSGRSGLVAEAFAMRLVQLGKESFIIGESTTPEITEKDFLIIISGSGKTKITNEIIKNIKKTKATICLITANKKSGIARKFNLIIQIKAKTKLGHAKSIEPLGSLFEQATFVYLDSLIILLMKKLDKSEKSMREKHSKIR